MKDNFDEIKQLKRQLSECERSKQAMIANVPGMVYRCNYDRSWTMTFLSDGAYDLTGYRPEELLYNNSISYNDIILPEYRDFLWETWRRNGSSTKPMNLEYKIMTADKKEKWVLERGLLVFNKDGDLEAMEGLVVDITEGKEKQEQIVYLNFHDQLTGIYNRKFYEEELKRLNNSRNFPLTLVLLDVNGLKLMNDAFGHNVGDKLLKKVAEITKGQCRESDIIARIGGDEFVLLLPSTSYVEAEIIVNRIKNVIQLEQIKRINLSVSFGWETKTEVEQDMVGIFKKAEDHMYRAKLSESFNMKYDMVEAILNNLYKKNSREKEHSIRVSQLCFEMGEALNLNSAYLKDLKIAGLMHDIGKIVVKDSILKKEDPLDEAELLEVKRHPEISYNILRSISEYGVLAENALCHHERFDGTGYPRGLKGEKIPLHSRIIALADSYAAMTGYRAFMEPLSMVEAIKEIRDNMGTQFDPDLAETFIGVIKAKELVETAAS